MNNSFIFSYTFQSTFETPWYADLNEDGNFGSSSETKAATKAVEDNSGFDRAYLKHVTPTELEEHRAELRDRCSKRINAANLVARYLYDETDGVFKLTLKTNEIYNWLKSEFGFTASKDNYYKACRNFKRYVNRK